MGDSRCFLATVAVFGKRRQSPFLATVAEFGDSRRFWQQSPKTATRQIRRLWSLCSVDTALDDHSWEFRPPPIHGPGNSNSAFNEVSMYTIVHLAEVDELLTAVVVFIMETIIRRLQPAVPHPRPGVDRRVRPGCVDRWKVSAARYVILRRLERARPKVLEILDAVLSVCFRVIQLHRRQITGVAASIQRSLLTYRILHAVRSPLGVFDICNCRRPSVTLCILALMHGRSENSKLYRHVRRHFLFTFYSASA